MAETKQADKKPEKEFLPFILPLLAIAIVVFLGWRWYSLKTARNPEVPQLTSKIEIEDLSSDDQDRLTDLAKGVGDYETSVLQKVDPDLNASAEVRYEIDGEKIYANIFASLPTLESGESYQSWLKTQNSEEWQKSDVLFFAKGGYISQFAVAADNLPLEIKITHEGTGLDAEVVLFQGVISAQ